MCAKINFNKIIKEDFDFNSVDVNDSTVGAYGVYDALRKLYNINTTGYDQNYI